MSQENQRTARKAQSMRSAANSSGSGTRSANKARSYRAESYNSSEPSKMERQTIFLDTIQEEEPVSEEKAEKSVSPFARLREKYEDAFGRGSSTGSTYKRKQKQKAARNDLLKKGIIVLIAIVVIILIIVIIINSTQVRNVSNISISSTASTQTLKWSGARKGLTYEVYRAEGSNTQYTLIESLTDGENTRTYDNLTAGTLYRYKIVTVKGNGEKTEGTEVQGYTKPNSVTGTSAATTADHSLTAKWSLQGSTASYELKYSLYDNLRDATTLSFTQDQAQYNSSTDTYTYTIDNLVVDQTYYMSMRTVCDDSASEWCSVFSGTVTDAANTAFLDTDQPMVALTFDGGPDGGTVTDRILDILAEYNGHATFFQTGVNAELYPEKMQQIVNAGHELGNHTYDESHVGVDVTPEDITDANTAIANACGVTPKLFRAPEGNVTDTIIEACTDNDMAIILWNFDSHDWELYDPNEIIERIQTYVEDGDIIQFRNIYDETADAIEFLVPWLAEQGYQFVTVTELLEAKTGSAPTAGNIYRSAYEMD